MAGVNAWGDVYLHGEERLRWFVAADDRWYRPSRETTVRQREISGVPVVETRIKVPGGDAVERVYGVADLGGAIVVEIYNDSSLPFAVAFDRGDIVTMREPSPSGVQGIDLPPGSVVFPIGHHTSLRFAILTDVESGPEAFARSRAITARELELLPSFDQVERGWLAALNVTSRVDVPEASWAAKLTEQRCKLLLSSTDAEKFYAQDRDQIDLVLDRAERVRLGDKPSQWVDQVADATEKILAKCAQDKKMQWFERQSILLAGMVLGRAGETRGRQDIELSLSKLDELADGDRSTLFASDSSRSVLDGSLSGVRQIAWIESQLVAQRPDGAIEICPHGIDASWLGINFECHRLIGSTTHMISFAVRWHADKPALLWELSGPAGPRVMASGLDLNFSSTQMRGETLLAGFVAPQSADIK